MRLHRITTNYADKAKKQPIRAWIVPRCCIDEVLINAIRGERRKYDEEKQMFTPEDI
jgi:hypothetical protein